MNSWWPAPHGSGERVSSASALTCRRPMYAACAGIKKGFGSAARATDCSRSPSRRFLFPGWLALGRRHCTEPWLLYRTEDNPCSSYVTRRSSLHPSVVQPVSRIAADPVRSSSAKSSAINSPSPVGRAPGALGQARYDQVLLCSSASSVIGQRAAPVPFRPAHREGSASHPEAAGWTARTKDLDPPFDK